MRSVEWAFISDYVVDRHGLIRPVTWLGASERWELFVSAGHRVLHAFGLLTLRYGWWFEPHCLVLASHCRRCGYVKVLRTFPTDHLGFDEMDEIASLINLVCVIANDVGRL